MNGQLDEVNYVNFSHKNEYIISTNRKLSDNAS